MKNPSTGPKSEAPERSKPKASRRDVLIGSVAAAAGLGVAGVGGGTAAAQSSEAFPNFFAWDQPIYPDVSPEFTMRIGHQAPPNVFVAGEHVQAVIMKNIVERGSAGRIRVEIFPANGLGNATEQLEQVQSGIVESCIQESAVPTIYPAIQVFSIPYLFPTHSIAWRVLDSAFAHNLFDSMAADVGISVVGVGENGGFRCFTNSQRPIRGPGDLQGLKIRTQEHQGQIAMIRAMGASPTPIPWAELYTSLQTGVVDGQENAVPTINLGRLQEVQSYLTLDNHIYGAHYFLVNAGWLARLPDELRAMVYEGGRQGSVASRGLNRILEAELIARLSEDFTEIYVPTADEMREFQEVAQPSYLEWLSANVDGSEALTAGIQAAVAAVDS